MVGEGRQAVREVLGRKDGGRARDRGRLERKRALGCRFQGGGVFEELLKTGWKLEYHQQTWFRNYISQSISYVHEARTIQSTPNYARYPSRRVS